MEFPNKIGYEKKKAICFCLFVFFLQNSIMLSKQLTTLGQEPVIYTFLKRKVYFPHEKLENGYLIFNSQI